MRCLILVLPIALVACATTGSENGSIAVETTSKGQTLASANCVVHTNGGSWNVVTPAVVAVGGANGDLRVVCDKVGYRTSEFVYKPSGGYSGSGVSIGIGGGSGHFGGGVGLGFPIAFGSRGYPSRVTIDMNPQ